MSKTKLQSERVGGSLFDEPTHPAMELLNAFASRGLVLRVEGNRIECDAQRLPVSLRAGLVTHRDGVIALLRLRQHAATRRRFEHWIDVDAELISFHRAASAALDLEANEILSFDGSKIKQKRVRNLVVQQSYI